MAAALLLIAARQRARARATTLLFLALLGVFPLLSLSAFLGLGWLLDPQRQDVFVYRPDGSVECLRAPEHLSAESPMAGFRLELHEIW